MRSECMKLVLVPFTLLNCQLHALHCHLTVMFARGIYVVREALVH